MTKNYKVSSFVVVMMLLLKNHYFKVSEIVAVTVLLVEVTLVQILGRFQSQ
jgi:hypothetical protein